MKTPILWPHDQQAENRIVIDPQPRSRPIDSVQLIQREVVIHQNQQIHIRFDSLLPPGRRAKEGDTQQRCTEKILQIGQQVDRCPLFTRGQRRGGQIGIQPSRGVDCG